MPGNGKKSVERDPTTGRFLPGNKSNGGRPKLPDELKQSFRDAAPEALEVLKKILRNEEARDADRIRCAEIILDRGYGKPVQAVDFDTSSAEVGVVLLPPRTDG